MKILFPKKSYVAALTIKKAEQNYHLPPSLIQHLPWVEFDNETKTVLLHDKTVGAAFDLSLMASDGKAESYLETLRNSLQGIFQEAFPLYGDNESPWIIQFYLQDELSMQYLCEAVKNYIQPTAQGSPFKNSYLELIKSHCNWLSKPEGVFYDDKVTDSQFHGGERKVKIAVYRRCSKKMAKQFHKNSIEELNQVAISLTSKLNAIGITVNRLNGREFRNWLIRWFNPSPAITNGNADELLNLIPYVEDKEELPFGYDFSQSLFYSVPESSETDGVWNFDKLPHRYLAVQALSKVPSVGQLTLEKNVGNYHYSLFDKFPSGAVFVMTVVLQSQDAVKEHLERIEHTARKSSSMAASMTFDDCQIAKAAIEKSNFLFPATLGVYLRGKNLTDLEEKQIMLEALLLNNGFQVLKKQHELVPLHSYLNQLPFCYNFQFDKKYLYRSNYVFAKQLANLLPLYGRERGTHQPLFQFLNRGGESFCLDPFNPNDKDHNSHMLILGSTGSGKSATSTDLLIKLMGTYRPYLVMVDAGNSFHLLKDYFKEEGLSVHHVAVTMDNLPVLNPFAESDAMLKQFRQLGNQQQNSMNEYQNLMESDSENSQRDYLGEMALAAELMITGGEKKEQDKMARQDRTLILDALVNAAHLAKNNNKQMLASNVIDAFYTMAAELESQSREPEKQLRLHAMADSMAFFTKDTLANQVFNQTGTPWPDADIILFEQGLFKDEGREAHNALAFMGLMSRTMAKAEKRQYQERFTVVFGDEIHTLTKNVLTVTYLTKCAKMSRKFGLWLWFATQNVSDFPAEAKKILSMIEFWLCLGMSETEVNAIEEFRLLSEEEKNLFRSIRKSAKKYVEGVLLCPRVKALFRNVPPRLSLALAMTEKYEKAERKKLMDEFNLTELEAAKMIASNML